MQNQVLDWRNYERARKLHLYSRHDMVKLLAQALVAIVLRNLSLYCAQGGGQWVRQEENWCCDLQGRSEEHNPKRKGQVAESHMTLLVGN